MTKNQLAALHTTRRRLEQLTNGVFDRHAYNAFLVQEGGLKELPTSSKDLDDRGFERVMAAMNKLLSKHGGANDRFGDNAARRAAGRLSREQEAKIVALKAELGAAGGPSYGLDALAYRMSNHRVKTVDQLSSAEASDVIEMLKAAVARREVERAHAGR